MTRAARLLLCAVLSGLVPVSAFAQTAAPAPAPPTRIWFAVGGGFVTLQGHCGDCGQAFPYRNTGAVVGNAGYRVTTRMDVGADLFWTQWENDSGHIQATALNGVAQFRPWESKGFFLRGGAGMAFVRNFVRTLGPNSDNSKALALLIGTGWAFPVTHRVGLQLFATERVGALGDLQTAAGTVNDVSANFWTIGTSIVFR